MTTTYRVVGSPVGRADGPEKVTGRAKYSIDVTLPGTLWCKVLRSPYPHARIMRIDAARALQLPGVHAALTGDDLRGVRTGKTIQDEPVLAWDRVLYIGDKVAAVAAEDEDIAQRALELIDIEYEELPAIFDPEEAKKPSASVLHPDYNSYKGILKPLERPSNVFTNLHWEKGNVEEGFRQADLIVERTYRTQRTHQVYLEPHNCLVWTDNDDKVQVWLGTKSPLSNRNALAAVIGVPPDNVTVNFAYVGGDFGGKGDILGVPICYQLAKKTGRPVKMVLDYSEELIAGNPRHESLMHVKAGVKRDGTITAWESDLWFNSGAYAGYKPGGNLPGANEIAGPYRIPHTRIDAWQVYTNTVPCGFQRGPGEVQGIFAGESHMDVIAAELGMDPVELRLKNVIREGDETPTGHHFQEILAEQVIREAVRASGFYDEKPSFVGRGLAFGNRTQFGGGTHVRVNVHGDSTVVANTSIFDPGTGTYTILKQAVAEELGIALDRIQVAPFSTDEMPADFFDFGVGGSRSSFVVPEASVKACGEVKERLRHLAAEFLGWDENIVSYEEGHLVNTRTRQRVAMEEIARRAGAPVSGRNHVAEELMSPYTSFVVQVAEVKVDPDTGEVKLQRMTAVHDVGQILNPIGFNGQVEGGLVQGIGQALIEDLMVEDGRVITASLGDFKVPNVRDIPELTVSFVEAPSGWGSYKVKAVGEHSNICTAPAIANAVFDACGVRIYGLPITSEKLYRALREGDQGTRT